MEKRKIGIMRSCRSHPLTWKLRWGGFASWTAGLLLAHASMAGASPAVGGGAASGDRPLLVFDGKPVMVGEVTGIPYQQGLAACKGAFARWKIMRPFAGGHLPPIDYLGKFWTLTPYHPGSAMYHQILQGVLDDYLREQITRRLEARYKPRLSGVLLKGGISGFATAWAKIDMRWNAFVTEAIEKGWCRGNFKKRFYQAFPHATHGGGGAILELAHDLSVEPGAYLAPFSAAPEILPDGRVAPWKVWEVRSWYEQWIVGEILAEHREKFIRMAAEQMGVWRFAIIGAVPPNASNLSAVHSLVDAISDAGGPIRAKVLRADRLLFQIESPTIVGTGYGSILYISRVYRISSSTVHPGVLLRSGRHSRLSPMYVCITQTRPPSMFAHDRLGPGDFPFSIGQKVVLKPIAERVLAVTKPMPGLRLPSVDNLVFWFNRPCADESRTFCGYPLPRVVVKNPWRPRAPYVPPKYVLPPTPPGSIVHMAPHFLAPHLVPLPPRK